MNALGLQAVLRIEILSFAGRCHWYSSLAHISFMIYEQLKLDLLYGFVEFFFLCNSIDVQYTWVVFHFRERENAEIYLSVGSKITGHATYVRGAFHETINRMIKLHFHGLFGLRVCQQWLILRGIPMRIVDLVELFTSPEIHRWPHAKWKSYFIPWRKTDVFDSRWIKNLF